MEWGQPSYACLLTGFCISFLSYLILIKSSGLVSGLYSHRGGQVVRYLAGSGVLGVLILAVTSSLMAMIFTLGIFLLVPAVLVLLRSQGQLKRRRIILKEFPILLDYLVLQVESGHSVQQSIRTACGLFDITSCLHRELKEMDNAMKVGCSIVQALEEFSSRLDTEETAMPIMAVIQAIRHGTPLTGILREQSTRMRDDLVLEGERFANTVSVKIMIPLLFFIFPASFLVIFSPVIVALSGWLP